MALEINKSYSAIMDNTIEKFTVLKQNKKSYSVALKYRNLTLWIDGDKLYYTHNGNRVYIKVLNTQAEIERAKLNFEIQSVKFRINALENDIITARRLIASKQIYIQKMELEKDIYERKLNKLIDNIK